MGKRKSTPTSLTMKKAAAAEGEPAEATWGIVDLKEEPPLVMDTNETDPSDLSPSSPGSSPTNENGYPNGHGVIEQLSNGNNFLVQSLQNQRMLEHQNGLSQSTKNLLDFVITENDSFVSQSPGGSAASGEMTPMLDRHYWSEEETNLLMELYVKNLSRFKERRHTGITIWEEIANEIKETLGVVVTGDQCHSKLRNMKRTFIRATARGVAPYPPDTTRDQQLVMKGTGGSMQKVTVPAPLAEMFASSLPVNFTNPSSFPASLMANRHHENSMPGFTPQRNRIPQSAAMGASMITPSSTMAPTKIIHNRTPTLVRPSAEASTQTVGTAGCTRRTKTQSLILKTLRRQQVENRMYRERMQRENQEQFGLLLRCVSELSQSVAEIKHAIGQA